MVNYENITKICVPSFEFEKKTKAFNKYKIFFVSLISMFTISVFIGAFFYAFMSSFLNLSTNHMEIYIATPIIIFLFTAYKLIQFLLALLCTYKIENNKIIKGRIKYNSKINEIDLNLITTAIAGIINAQSIQVLKLIKLNLNKDFVYNYFETDIYVKKEYTNFKLIKETKYALIYSCDNKKKLVIPKVYDGICECENKKEESYKKRIIKSSAIVFFIVFAISICDIAVLNYKNINEFAPLISASKSDIQDKLEDYGYLLKRSGSTYSTFEKDVGNGERTSEIIYYFDKKGNIKNVKLDLFYNSKSKNVSDELSIILDTIDAEFDNDVDEFIEVVKDNIDGEYKVCKISSKICTLSIGRSGEYIHIH